MGSIIVICFMMLCLNIASGQECDSSSLVEQLNRYCTARTSNSPRIGKAGPRGIPGVTGPRGATGSPGVTGARGGPGLPGVAGPRGPAGSRGRRGRRGVPGVAGLPGTDGPNGRRGLSGARGPPGVLNYTKVGEIVAEEMRGMNFPNSCVGAASNLVGEAIGGVFHVYPGAYGSVLQVYCDLISDGGGWTLFQRRMDGSVNFTRNWEDYVNGFGIPDGEYWMGLEKLHRLTSDGNYELRVDLGDWEGKRRYAQYSTFSVAGASDKYRLRVGGYVGDAGDSFSLHDNKYFSASNQDNDGSSTRHCAQVYKGGWWFEKCYDTHLNGVYHNQTTGNIARWQGIIWYKWKGGQYSLKFTEMKFRKKN